MLSSGEASLARRDRSLPGLATLLDPDDFLAALRTHLPGVDLRGARSTYVRYKPGTNCLSAYQLDVSGEMVDVYAKAYCLNDQGKLSKDSRFPGVSGPLGPGRVVMQDKAIVVSVFPNDKDVRSLYLLATDEGRARLLKKVLPDRPDLWSARLQRLAYKPDRRYVGRLLVAGEPQAAVKFYTESSFLRTNRSAKLVRSGQTLRIARRLGRSKRHCVMALEWMPGRLLGDALEDASFPSARLSAVGAALAELHLQSPKRFEAGTRERDTVSLLAVADTLAVICPNLAERVTPLAARLANYLADQALGAHIIHGDFYAKQVLLQGDQVAMIDLDSARCGHPAADLGNFMAHQESYALSGRVPLQRLDSDREALLEGYRAGGTQLDLGEIDLYTAIGLLRIAVQPFRNRESDWLEKIGCILERVEAIVQRSETATLTSGGAI